MEESEFQSHSAADHMHWLLSAFLSLMLFSAGAYILGAYSEDPVVSFGLCSFGYLLSGVMLMLVNWVKLSRSLGKLAWVTDSAMYRDGKLAAGVDWAIVGSAFLFIGQVSVLMGYNGDPNSRGVISVIIVGTSMAGAILHYFLYNEKLTTLQVLGMLGSTLGLVIISIQSGSEGKLTAFLYGLGGIAGFCLKNLTARICDVKRLDADVTNVLGMIGMGVIGALSLVGFYLAGTNPFAVSGWEPLLMNLLGGFLNAWGAYFITLAIMTGKVGPAAIIGNSFGVVQGWLEFFFMGIVPNHVKIVGSAVILVSTCVMLLGDSLVEALGCRKPREQPLKEPLLQQ